MKATKLVALGLVSASVLSLGVSTVMAAAIDGDSVNASTNATVDFTVIDDEVEPPVIEGPEPGGTVDPTEPGPGGNGNTTDPDLKINFVPNLRFGTIEYHVNAKEAVQAEADKQLVNIYDKDGNLKDEKKEINNFAQVWNSKNLAGWNFTVQMGNFDSGMAADALSTLTINFAGVKLADKNNGTNDVVYYGKQATLANNQFTVDSSNTPVNIGNLRGNTGPTAEDSVNNFDFEKVTLNVPAGEKNIQDGVKYTANLTWTATPVVAE